MYNNNNTYKIKLNNINRGENHNVCKRRIHIFKKMHIEDLHALLSTFYCLREDSGIKEYHSFRFKLIIKYNKLISSRFQLLRSSLFFETFSHSTNSSNITGPVNKEIIKKYTQIQNLIY